MINRINYLTEFNKYSNYKYNKHCKWGICHAQITILSIKKELDNVFNNKELSRFYRKRHFKDYIRIKYFKR